VSIWNRVVNEELVIAVRKSSIFYVTSKVQYRVYKTKATSSDSKPAEFNLYGRTHCV
jgi:hypothetical protein